MDFLVGKCDELCWKFRAEGVAVGVQLVFIILSLGDEINSMGYELGRQYEVWPCPFSKQETISIVHFPKSVTVKQSRTASLPGAKGFHVNRDVYVVSILV